VPAEPGPAAVQALEGERLDADDVGVALELEGLYGELVLADDVEDSVERVVDAVLALLDEPVAAAGPEAELLEVQVVAAGADPLTVELRVLVRPEHLLDRVVELAVEVDERQTFWCGDREGVGRAVGAHGWCSPDSWVGVTRRAYGRAARRATGTAARG
jgi:hypothetical protein